MDKKEEKRTRRWVFTLNNPKEGAKELCERVCAKVSVRYIVAGNEEAPTTGTKHIQGYVEFENTATLSQCKERIQGAHWEPAIGNARENRAYCSKGGDFHEVGEAKNPRFHGSDMASEVVSLMLNEGLSPAIIAVKYKDYASYIVNHYGALNAMYRDLR